MRKTFHLSIVSPERVLFDGETVYLSLPGGAGYMGVLPDHMPLISSLKPGVVELRTTDDKSIRFTIKNTGLFEIQKNKASILLDAVDTAAFPSGV